MNETSYSLQMSYMLDTDGPRFRELMASEPSSRERLVDAGIEHARRVSGHRTPPRDVPAGMVERWKGPDRVALEFGLPNGTSPAIGALGALLQRTRLSAGLPHELSERGLRGAVMSALNDSWRRLYRTTGPVSDESRRLQAGLKSSSDVFAERVARHGRRSTNSLAAVSTVYQTPRMVPGA